MNRFLGNLINRHQQHDASAASSVVEPRPVSRFEAEVDTPVAVEPNANEAVSQGSTKSLSGLSKAVNIDDSKITNDPSTQSEFKQPDSASPSFAEPDPNKKQSSQIKPNHIDDLSARIDTFSQMLSQNPQGTEANTAKPHKSQSNISKNSDGLSNESSSGQGVNYSTTDGINQKVESLVRHLADDPAIQQPERATPTSNLVDHQIADNKHQQLATRGASEVVATAPKPDSPESKSQLEKTSTHQLGLLQPPSWLTKMQSDLGKRWQDLNSVTQPPQPVVNVTIGRVEVRALKTEMPRQSNQKNKPSGVMSLEDYLKARA